MNYILFDDNARENLLPLTYTKPVAELRTGILKIAEKWNLFLNTNCSYLTRDHLQEKYPVKKAPENCLINGSVIPDANLVKTIQSLKPKQLLTCQKNLVAVKLDDKGLAEFSTKKAEQFLQVNYENEIIKINYPWDIFALNGKEIELDYQLITKERNSLNFPGNCQVLNPENVFIEEGAKLNFATINAEKGPVYIGKNAEIMEGSVIRGPFALCDSSVIKLSAKIYGPTTIGPFSKAGGEINNSVIQGYSNKGHDGFLGNSVIGEWCNIGADSNNSNLKNNYAGVKIWNYPKKGFIKTGRQFCGLIMGDHSKCGINTMFNTGTVAGVSANIFGSGFQRNFIPSFSWGGTGKIQVYGFEKAIETAKLVMERRNIVTDDNEIAILKHVFETTKEFRRYF